VSIASPPTGKPDSPATSPAWIIPLRRLVVRIAFGRLENAKVKAGRRLGLDDLPNRVRRGHACARHVHLGAPCRAYCVLRHHLPQCDRRHRMHLPDRRHSALQARRSRPPAGGVRHVEEQRGLECDRDRRIVKVPAALVKSMDRFFVRSSVFVRGLKRERVEEGRNVQCAKSRDRVGLSLIALRFLGEQNDELVRGGCADAGPMRA